MDRVERASRGAQKVTPLFEVNIAALRDMLATADSAKDAFYSGNYGKSAGITRSVRDQAKSLADEHEESPAAVKELKAIARDASTAIMLISNVPRRQGLGAEMAASKAVNGLKKRIKDMLPEEPERDSTSSNEQPRGEPMGRQTA